MTDLRVSQLGVEAWIRSPTTTSVVVTQVGAEVWVQSLPSKQLNLSQFGVEAWVASNGPPLHMSVFGMASGKTGHYAGKLGVGAKTTAQAKITGITNIIASVAFLSCRVNCQAHVKIGLPASPAPGPVPDFDWRVTVISQYANSPILLQLLDNFFQYIDQTVTLDNFYKLIWNVDTAVGYGLDVWGRIVGVSRTLQLVDLGDNWGFKEATDAEPFDQAPFYAGPTASDSFNLSDEAYRTLIFAKALANISDGSIPSINRLLMNLFGAGGNCYVEDNNDMTLTYKFTFSLTPVQLAIINQSGVLPKPCGVSFTVDAPP